MHRAKVRFVLPLLLLVAACWYVHHGYSYIVPEPLFSIIYIPLAVFTVVFTHVRWHRHAKGLRKSILVTLRAIAFILATSIVLLSLALLVKELLANIGRLFSNSGGNFWPTVMVLIGGLISTIALLLIYGIFRNPYRYRVHHVKPIIPGLPSALKGLRIVQLSDIHAGTFLYKKPINKGIAMINDLRPDLILFTGDLVNRKSDEIEPYIKIFSNLSASLGIYSVMGNHDYGDYYTWPDATSKRENLLELIDAHKQLGWNLLRNEHRIIQYQGADLALVGVDNLSASNRFHSYGDLSLATQGLAGDITTVLLSHDPSHWRDEVVKRFKEIDLTLSGHTHGFQFGIEWKNVIKWSPVQYIYKEWAGLYQEGKQFLYVNRGFGMLGYPGRVGILPEITLLELS